MEIRNPNVQQKLLELNEIQNLRREKYFTWLKNIITLAVGLFGIIISLKSDKPQNFYQHIFFLISISSLAFGIFTGIIVLYSEIHVLAKVKNRYSEKILKMLNDEENEIFEQIGRSKFYDFSEYFCFISFTISLTNLVLYSYFSS